MSRKVMLVGLAVATLAIGIFTHLRHSATEAIDRANNAVIPNMGEADSSVAAASLNHPLAEVVEVESRTADAEEPTHLPARPVELLVTVRAASTHEPVSGVRVRVEFADGEASEWLTDSAGAARFEGSCTGLATVLTSGLGTAQSLLEVGSNEVEVLIYGDFKWSGQVSDLEGAPIGQAQIFVGGSYAEVLPPFSCLTDDEGRFELCGLREDASILVRAVGFEEELIENISVPQLLSGQPLKVYLTKGSVGLSVVAMDELGDPIVGASVQLTSARPDGPKWSTVEAETGTDGRAEFASVPDRMAECSVSHPSFAEAVKEIALSADSTGNEMQLTLARGFDVHGQVSGLPREELAKLRAVGLSELLRRPIYASVDEEGRFRLRHLAPGTWWVGIYHGTDSALAQEVVSGVDGETVPWHPALPALIGSVAGRVEFDGAFKPREWEIVMNDAAAELTRSAEVRSDGTFQLDCLPGSTMSISLLHADGVSYVDTVDGVEAGTSAVVLDATKFTQMAGLIRGKFVGDGAPFAAGVIACKMIYETQTPSPSPVEGAWTTVGPDGSFEVGGLSEGTFSVWMTDKQGQSVELDRVSIEENQPVSDLGSIALQSKGTVEVRAVVGNYDSSARVVRYFIRSAEQAQVMSGQASLSELLSGYRIAELYPGGYEVLLDDGKRNTGWLDFVIVPSAQVVLDAEFVAKSRPVSTGKR